MKKITAYMTIALLLAACSTTKHLPEGEMLYTGQKAMIVHNPTPTKVGETAIEEVEAALATAPNNSLLGSSTVRIPFPFGLWVYNGFQKYEKGLGKWIFNRFAAKPVLMSTVNPDIRIKAASNLLRDYGYFNGTVSYETFTDPKDSLKAKIQYTVDMRNPYVIDTVTFRGFSPRTQRIMELGRRRSLISPGEQFNVLDLDGERTRISTLLRNVGCYYFRPDYLTYQADTTLVPGGHVSMRMVPVPGMPPVAEKPFYLGRKTIEILGKNGEAPNDSVDYKGLRIYTTSCAYAPTCSTAGPTTKASASSAKCRTAPASAASALPRISTAFTNRRVCRNVWAMWASSACWKCSSPHATRPSSPTHST